MASKEVRHTGSFTAVHENGRKRKLHIYTTFQEASDTGSAHAWLPVAKALRTDDGEPVNRLGKGKYRLPATGETLRSEDAGAP